MYGLVTQSFKNTRADNPYQKYELLDIYEIFKPVDINQDIGNRRMLWYATRLTNYVSVLDNGFKFPPEEAPLSGYPFGKGIYFSDMASKSLGQCFPSNGIGLILLCEVRLGESLECKLIDCKIKDKLSGYNSVKACGMIEPDIVNMNGVYWPTGELIKKPPSYVNYINIEHVWTQ